jgi:hypothetical protein
MKLPFLFQVASEGGINVEIDQIKRARQNKHGLPHRLEEPGGGQAGHGQIYVGIRADWPFNGRAEHINRICPGSFQDGSGLLDSLLKFVRFDGYLFA